MDNALLVRGFECFGYLPRDVERLIERDPGSAQGHLSERPAIDQLHYQRQHAAAFLDAVNLRDVRVVERREDVRLTLEACNAVSVAGERARQDLDGDVALETSVAGFVDFAHAAFTQRVEDFVLVEPRATGKEHGLADYATCSFAGSSPGSWDARHGLQRFCTGAAVISRSPGCVATHELGPRVVRDADFDSDRNEPLVLEFPDAASPVALPFSASSARSKTGGV